MAAVRAKSQLPACLSMFAATHLAAAVPLTAIMVAVADVVREQQAACGVDQEVSFMQHSQNWRRRGASSHRVRSLQAPRGQWVMSPDIAAFCDPNLAVLPVIGTPEEPAGSQGVSAMPSACKTCVDGLGQELDYRYEYLVSTEAFETVNLCADGPFSGCLSCTMTTWVADEWGPQLGRCCDMEDASAGCSSYLAEFQARNVGQRAEACRVSSLSNASSAPSPSAPAANATDNSTAGSTDNSTASPAANSTDGPAPGDLGEDAAPTPVLGEDTTPAPVLGEDAAPAPALGEDATPAPVLGEDAAPALGEDAAPAPAPVLGEDAAPTPVTEDSVADSTPVADVSAAEPTDSAAASATESTDTSAPATDDVAAGTTTAPAADSADTSAAATTSAEDSAADATTAPAADAADTSAADATDDSAADSTAAPAA